MAATAEGAGAADAQPDGQPQAPEGRGTHTGIADHVEPDADDHADADQGDPGGHDTNGKGSHNGKGARSKKRAKTT